MLLPELASCAMHESLIIPADEWSELWDEVCQMEPDVMELALQTPENAVEIASTLLERYSNSIKKIVARTRKHSDVFWEIYGHDGATFSTVVSWGLERIARRHEEVPTHQKTVLRGYQGLVAAIGSMEFLVPGKPFTGEHISLSSLLQDHKDLLKKVFLNLGGQFFDLKIPTELPDVYAHRTTVLNLLVNMLQNAYRHGEASWVYLECEQVASAVRLIIEDDGYGISDDAVDHLYDYQFTTSHHGGTGLGLAFADMRMAYNGGRISHEPHGGIGGGAKFIMEMPAVAPQ